MSGVRGRAVVLAPSIEEWLEGLKEGYGKRFASVFEELGVEDVDDLNELVDGKGDAALRRALEAKGAKTIQVQRIRRAIGGTGAPPPIPAVPALGSVLGAAPPQPPPSPLPAERAAPPGPVRARSHSLPRPAPSDIPGLRILHDGRGGPRIYMVHGIDGDISGAGFPYRAVAPLLEPCHSLALAFDAEAARCDSIQTLAMLYNERIMSDAVRHAHSPIFIAGYSMGCVIAHQMALQFQENFTEVGLLLFGFEVSWPPDPSWLRVGGYPWLGGDIEAPLLVARSIPDGQEWATREAKSLVERPEEVRDPDDVQSRVFLEVVAKRRSSRWTDFQSYVLKGGRNMERLHRMTGGSFAPQGVFRGRALLVVAPESPESHIPARCVNLKYCSALEVVYSSGTHFNMLQKDRAPVVANAVLGFLRSLGYNVPEPIEFEAPGL